MIFDESSDTQSHGQDAAELMRNVDDSVKKTEEKALGEDFGRVVHTLDGFASSYKKFQEKIRANKALIDTLQAEIKTSKEKKNSLEMELSEMPAPGSFKESNEDSENIELSVSDEVAVDAVASDEGTADVVVDEMDSSTPISSEPGPLSDLNLPVISEESDHTDGQPEKNHSDSLTEGANEIANNDQAVVSISGSKSEIKTKTCGAIERYIEAIKTSIDHKSDDTESYLQPLNLSCSLLGAQIGHTKLLERLVAAFDEQLALKAKEKEMHDIVDLLAEQFAS